MMISRIVHENINGTFTQVASCRYLFHNYKYLVSHEKDGLVESLTHVDDEQRDLAAEDPDRLAAMRERLERFRAGLRTAPENRQRLSPATRERLEQLGYVVE